MLFGKHRKLGRGVLDLLFDNWWIILRIAMIHN
jgi:hypothetical protein